MKMVPVTTRPGFTVFALLGLLTAAACGSSESPDAGVDATGVAADATPEVDNPFEDSMYVLNVIPENYTLLLDNEHVRVIEARIPPGTTEPPHRHASGVSIAMTDYLIEHLQPNGEWTPSQKREPGTVYWSEGSLHQVRNVGTTYSHTIRVELK